MYKLKKSTRKKSKYQVQTPNGSTIHFGAVGYEDYTTHKDAERKNRYIARHAKRENWTQQGLNTAGFWSRWLLWEEPDLTDAIRNIENKFNINIVRS